METSNETSSTNEHQDTSSQVEVQSHPQATEHVEKVEVNSGFDSMVDEAVKTKAQAKQEENTSSPSNLTYSPEDAAGIALKGLNGAVGLMSRLNGFEIQLGQEMQMLFAGMATPLIMKHGKTIQGLLNPVNVDLESNVPEYLAVAAVAVVGVPTYLQIKEVNKLKKLQLQKDQQDLSEAHEKAKETGNTDPVVNQEQTEKSEAA